MEFQRNTKTGPGRIRAVATKLTGSLLTGLLLVSAPCPAQTSLPASTPAGVAGASGPGWIKGHNSSVRLIFGAMPGAGSSVRLLAGVEIRLADGWKTYWRHPGDDGGLPPSFDWTGSKNLKSATVRFPPPERIKSLNGTALGYGKAVVFPIEIVAEDPTRPVELMLALEYGICREICIPAEAKLQLRIAPGTSSLPPDLASALSKVPQPTPAEALVKSAKAELTGPKAAITLDIAAGPAAGRIDLFAETMAGSYLPVPQKLGEPTGGIQRFRIDLKGVEDAAKLAGQPLRLTVTGVSPAAEILWTVK